MQIDLKIFGVEFIGKEAIVGRENVPDTWDHCLRPGDSALPSGKWHDIPAFLHNQVTVPISNQITESRRLPGLNRQTWSRPA